MNGLEPLVCISCVEMVDATDEAADGWVLVPHSVKEGDEHDDSQWKCPACADGSDVFRGFISDSERATAYVNEDGKYGNDCGR